MECKREENREECGCTYNCSKRGLCCECVKYHRENGEIPGCFFPRDKEMSYDRSIRSFIECFSER